MKVTKPRNKGRFRERQVRPIPKTVTTNGLADQRCIVDTDHQQTEFKDGPQKAKTVAIWRNALTIFLILLQLSLVLIIGGYHSFHRVSSSSLTSFQYDQASIRYLENAVSPYSVFRPSDREVATSNYLKTKSFNDEKRRLFKYFFHDYIKFHAANRQNASRLFIYRPPPTGMGDRFRTFVFAYWAAVISRRVFLIDWQAPFPLENFFQTANRTTDFFFRNETDYPRSMPATNSNRSGTKPAFVLLRKSKVDHARFASVLESDIHSVAMLMHGPVLHPPMALFAQRNLPFEVFNFRKLPELHVDSNFRRALMHHVLHLSEGMRADHWRTCRKLNLRCAPRLAEDFDVTDQGWRGNIRNSDGRPYIAVHARVGIGIGEGNITRFSPLSRNLLLTAFCLASRAVRLALFSGNPALPIFLATDTPKFRPLFQEVAHRLSGGRVTVIHGGWDVAHTDRLRDQHKDLGQIFDKQQDSYEWEVVYASYMDLIMLGHAEHIISIFSTFPRLGQALGDSYSLTELGHEICTGQRKRV